MKTISGEDDSTGNLAGGTAGAIPFQSGVGITDFTVGNAGDVLQSNGVNPPTFVNPSSLPSSSTAINLVGGLAGTVPYQNSPGQTLFAAGSAGTVLKSNGSSPPTFVSPETLPSLTAVNVKDGTAGAIPYQSAASTTGFVTGTTGQLLQSNGTSTPSFVNTSSLTVNKANNISAGSAGSLPYQASSGSTSFVSGVAGQILQSNGSSPPTFVNSTAVPSGSAINVVGGSTGSLPYQSATSTTAMLAAGASNQVLKSGATPSWTSTPTLDSLTLNSTNTSLNATNASTTVSGIISNSSSTAAPFEANITGVQDIGFKFNQSNADGYNYMQFNKPGFTGALGQLNTGQMIINSNTTTIVQATNAIQLISPIVQTPFTNANFLYTDSSGNIQIGSILPVYAGGTGRSTFRIPETSTFTTPGSYTFTFNSECRYYEIWLTGGGGRGGASNVLGSIGGGGGGGGGTIRITGNDLTPMTFVVGHGGQPGGGGIGDGTVSTIASGTYAGMYGGGGYVGGDFGNPYGGSGNDGQGNAFHSYDLLIRGGQGARGNGNQGGYGGGSYYASGSDSNQGYGQGGGGGTNAAGNNGADGIVRIIQYYQ